MMWNKKNLPSLSTTVFLTLSGITLGLTLFGITTWLSSATRSTAAIVPALSKKALPYKNWGLVNSKSPSHIQALEAWNIEKGSHNVKVAVIDTGVDISHRDLRQNIWKGTLVKQGKKKIRVFGWDFSNNRPNPNDEHGHGTHVAGIIGAVSNPAAGVSGVSRKVSIIPIKYYSTSNSGSTNLKNTIRALNYAIDQGAQIINYSGGGPEFSHEEYVALKKAESKGILVVAAAGNERQNADLYEHYYYPAAYGLSNIISVAATDMSNQLLRSSNWGIKNVDIAAPGENIYSTLPRGRDGKERYGYMSGTSQATAFVSGIAALMLSQRPKLKPQEIKKLILQAADRFPQLKGKTKTGGRVNAYRALLALKNFRTKQDKKELVDSKQTPVASSSALEPVRGFARQ